MLALSPPLFQTFGWPLDDPIIHNFINNNLSRDQTQANSNESSIPTPQIGQSESTVFGSTMVVKKLNHNANERDRRKRINSLYSFLFSLLPSSDQKKKLSIPVTVSRVVKYIPELQKEVEELVHKKEELSSKILTQHDESPILPQKKRRKYSSFSDDDNDKTSSSSFVSTAQINASEIMIQISTIKANKCLICEALQILEENGLHLLNASSFETFGQRLFHNLHLQVEGNKKMESDKLRRKLLSIYQ